MSRQFALAALTAIDLTPPELDSDDAVVSYVMSHRGALGYVSGGAKLDKAKPVAVR